MPIRLPAKTSPQTRPAQDDLKAVFDVLSGARPKATTPAGKLAYAVADGASSAGALNSAVKLGVPLDDDRMLRTLVKDATSGIASANKLIDKMTKSGGKLSTEDKSQLKWALNQVRTTLKDMPTKQEVITIDSTRHTHSSWLNKPPHHPYRAPLTALATRLEQLVR